MNPFISFLVRTSVAIPTAGIVWLLSFFAYDQTLLLSGVFSITGGTLAYLFISIYAKSRFLKKNKLTRKEYRYIMKNLEEAKRKISRLQKTLFSIKHIQSLRQRIDLLRVSKKIYRLTKREPKRFYKAERFYFSHLDSVVELTEKYAFLSAQPKKNRELDQSLYETRLTLNQLAENVEKDLYHVLSDDIDHLNFEIDVARHSIKTLKDTKSLEESRRLK
jgi:5-bromo-4-chloroindolyl phosphate hydrolysis protein